MGDLVASIQTWSMVITALATMALGVFTWVLARETNRLSSATSQAHVVATLEPNQWALNHVDLIVTNTGNGSAHDVAIAFNPELEKYQGESKDRPLRHIGLLKPGQSVSSYVGDNKLYHDKTYQVSTSWKHRPGERERQSLSYELSMGDYEGYGHLGARSPFIQMAEQLKKLREDWEWVARGSHKIKTDNYSSSDREKERKRLEALRKSQTKPQRTRRTPKGGGKKE
ncbi:MULTISPECIES: hypothetical protein [unclassified Mesorhizobium]|uniref:hypothetical protein n=1 Tax=unclassified Mesorhizobium TaxID=325217 RepID=UPI000FCC4C0B|nr:MULTISPECIES: hypothetical protein [unclassified Mesorhizobium]RUW77706.1 hypothetical protein EOA31_03720 [Mesorhizobium sp. M4B.F.Ca.ET.049.02.1.2]TGV25012.1 hypothetical protein EN786_16350 [Mesorhizobium sp. M4B.F.Ca.ET.143.01.1.1]